MYVVFVAWRDQNSDLFFIPVTVRGRFDMFTRNVSLNGYEFLKRFELYLVDNLIVNNMLKLSICRITVNYASTRLLSSQFIPRTCPPDFQYQDRFKITLHDKNAVEMQRFIMSYYVKICYPI